MEPLNPVRGIAPTGDEGFAPLRVSTDVAADRRRQGDPMTVVIQIALEELDPPVGEVHLGGDAVRFAGWLDLFHLLGRLLKSPQSSPDE